MRVRDKHEIQLLSEEVDSILSLIQRCDRKTYRPMQINPMIHTWEILKVLEVNFKDISKTLSSLTNHEKPSFFYNEESERHMFDHIYWISSYLDFNRKKIEDYQKDYLEFKASLPTHDLEDLYSLINFAKITLTELANRIFD